MTSYVESAGGKADPVGGIKEDGGRLTARYASVIKTLYCNLTIPYWLSPYSLFPTPYLFHSKSCAGANFHKDS